MNIPKKTVHHHRYIPSELIIILYFHLADLPRFICTNFLLNYTATLLVENSVFHFLPLLNVLYKMYILTTVIFKRIKRP